MSHKTRYLLLAYMILVTGVLFYFMQSRMYDDPFITYRYARNLAQGTGFQYNTGERVLSTTTPLFTILLAILYPIETNIPLLASLIGAASLALGGIFIWDLARSWQTPAVGWVGLFLYPTFPLLLITLGSETPLYLAFAFGAFAFYARDKLSWAAIFCALVALTRPDGLLVPGILCADYLIRQRRMLPWKSVGIFLAFTLPWVLFAWMYFGSPVPVTLSAKQHQGNMSISPAFGPGLIAFFRPAAGKWFRQVEALLAILGIVYLVIQFIDRTSVQRKLVFRWGLVLLWVIIYFLAYAWLGVSSYFWYYGPVIAGLYICVGLGVEAIRTIMGSYLGRNRAESRSGLGGQVANLIPIVASLVLVCILAAANIGAMITLSRNTDGRIEMYRLVGEWVKVHTAPDVTVGAVEVGALGYYSERTIMDFAGLIQPEVAEYLTETTTYADSANWALDRYQPDVVVLHEDFLPEDPANYISRRCREAQRFLGEPHQYKANMIVYFCR